MNVNIKRLLVWAGIFCVLLAYVLVFERISMEDEENIPEKLDRVFPLPQAEIRSIQIIQGDKNTTLMKKDRSWKMVSPADTSISEENIRSLVSAVADVVKIDVIEQNPTNPAQYGLEQPKTTINVFYERKRDPITLLLGNSAPTGVSMYGLHKNDNSVLMIGTYLRFSINSFLGKL